MHDVPCIGVGVEQDPDGAGWPVAIRAMMDYLGHQQESLHCLGDVKDVGVRVQQDLQAGHRANGLHAGMKQFAKKRQREAIRQNAS